MKDAPIPLSAPDITDSEIEAIVSVLRGSRLSLGPVLKEFEICCRKICGLRSRRRRKFRHKRVAPGSARARHRRGRRSNRSIFHFHRCRECDPVCAGNARFCGH